MDNTVTEMINAFEEFASSTKQKNHRYLSWEHCYQQFRLVRLERDKKEPDLDYLSLQLELVGECIAVHHFYYNGITKCIFRL